MFQIVAKTQGVSAHVKIGDFSPKNYRFIGVYSGTSVPKIVPNENRVRTERV